MFSLVAQNSAAGWVSFGTATGGSLYAQNVCLRGRLQSPPTICARLDYNFAADSFQTKELYSRLSLKDVDF